MRKLIEKKDLLAFCGLYCKDYAGFTGEIVDAASKLRDTLSSYKFERMASSLFSEQLKDYDKFLEMLNFIITLKCETICRFRESTESGCSIRKCCKDRKYFACYECEDYGACEKLRALEKLHGDAHLKNIRQIREMGLELWIERGNRYWFGDLDKKEKIKNSRRSR